MKSQVEIAASESVIVIVDPHTHVTVCQSLLMAELAVIHVCGLTEACK